MEVKLHDTYFSEIEKDGCEIMLDEPPIGSGFTRSYHSGCIRYLDSIYRAKLVKFDSGNIQILSILADEPAPLLSLIEAHKKKHRFPLALRTLCRYVYYLASPLIGIMCFWFFLHGMWGGFFKGFLMMTVLRFFYTEGRNYLR